MGLAKAGPAGLPFRTKIVQAVVLAGIMLSSLGLYLIVEYWRGRSNPLVTQTAWDRRIPFMPGWVWVYLFPYVLAPVLAALMSWESMVWYIKRGLVVLFISLAVFVMLPTRTIRPNVDNLGDGLTAQFYRNMVSIDGPAANAAPSLHVSLTALLAWTLIRDYRRAWQVALIWSVTILVWASTLFTWQHHLIDVAAGALLGTTLAYPWHAHATLARRASEGTTSLARRANIP
jgi:membrane-associated phospholipid phosphatase